MFAFHIFWCHFLQCIAYQPMYTCPKKDKTVHFVQSPYTLGFSLKEIAHARLCQQYRNSPTGKMFDLYFGTTWYLDS